jgi:hypothetical protein
MELLRKIWYNQLPEARTVDNRQDNNIFQQHHNNTAAKNWLQVAINHSRLCDANSSDMNTDVNEM